MSIWKGTEGQVIILPEEIEHLVAKSPDWKTVRQSIRKGVYMMFKCIPDQRTFDRINMEEMRKGLAPYCHPSQVIGKFNKMQIHHKTRRSSIEDKTKANLLENLVAMSPLFHHHGNHIDEVAHYGPYYGMEAKRKLLEKEMKQRSYISY